MGEEVSWHVDLAVKPGELENFRALTRDMVEYARSEPGVLIYERFASSDGKAVQVYERYADSAAAMTHLLEFRKVFGERFSGMVDRKRFTVSGTPSDALRQVLDGVGATVYLEPFGGLTQ